MNVPALSQTAPGGAALVLDVEALLGRLPAATRAQLAWVKAPIASGLARLYTDPFSDELLNEVVEQVLRPMSSLGRAIAEVLAENPDRLRAAIVEDIERDRGKLLAYIQDADAADTAQWVFGLMRSLFDVLLSHLDPALLPMFYDADFDQALADDKLRSLMRGQVALMAAMQGVKEQAAPDRIVDLLDIAFLQLIAIRDYLRKHGLWITAFPDETPEKRRQDTLRYAHRVRDVLTNEDWEGFDEARFRDLR
jgi:hypothetical protein